MYHIVYSKVVINRIIHHYDINTDTSKVIFTSVVAAVSVMAAILSLSVFVNAFADTDDVQTPKSKPPGTGGPHKPEYCKNGKKFIPIEGGGGQLLDDDNGNADSRHDHKVNEINKLFRSKGGGGNNDDGSSSAIANIPAMNFDTVNGTNSTATVTIAVCDGIVPGPCLDKTTGRIIP
jgi:hypothetical protein